MLRLLLTLVFLAATARLPAAAVSLTEDKIAAIDAIFARYNRPDTPGFAVGVVQDGRLVFARSYGQANLDYRLPITPRTSFHLASLSKQFTAAAVAQLIVDGKLSLETPVQEYFPAIARFQADIRVKHLLYFTSGLPEYTSLPRAGGQPWFSDFYFTTDEAIATTLRAPALRFRPGEQWEYSNVNYMLLAKIVERASGMTLAQFLQERFFGPLGMTHSQLNDDSTLIVPERATGYVERPNPEVRAQMAAMGVSFAPGEGYAQLLRVSPHFGGSGVFSSLEDLARWEGNFFAPRVGGADLIRQLSQRLRFAHAKDNDALGFVYGEYAGREMLWFSGADLDTSTYFARFPAEHLTVICLSNLTFGHAEDKAREILAVLFPGPPGQ